NIIMIDDEESILEAYASLLVGSEISVKTINNPLKAIEYIKNHSVDVIISDITMPEMSGIDFFKKIKNDMKYSGIFIFITGFWKKEFDYLLKEGVSKVFTKPLSHHDLLEFLSGFLQKTSDPEEGGTSGYADS
ncbi:MAG: response regulator, partial [Deltaproteobacteria bacterium]|nr:response regulator [Deltaproteobacteria bacterium]